jgi:hypothetical protein
MHFKRNTEVKTFSKPILRYIIVIELLPSGKHSPTTKPSNKWFAYKEFLMRGEQRWTGLFIKEGKM